MNVGSAAAAANTDASYWLRISTAVGRLKRPSRVSGEAIDAKGTTKLLREALDSAGASVWEWDIGADAVVLEPRSARMHGLPVVEDRAVLVTVAEWEKRVFAEDIPPLWQQLDDALGKRMTFVTEFRTHDPSAQDGYRWVQTLGRAIFDENGNAVRMLGLHLDITERRAIEEKLRGSERSLKVSEERLSLALESGEDGLWDLDLTTGEIWVSDQWRARLGHVARTSTVKTDVLREIIPPEDLGTLRRSVRHHITGSASAFQCEHRIIRGDGRCSWVLTRGRIVGRDAKGSPTRMVGTQIDISRRKAAEMRVTHMASHDPLTDLPNRSLFHARLQTAFAEGHADHGPHALLVCDLDRFKAVNDALGHLAGDEVLRVIAGRLSVAVRNRDLVARLGSDEFAIILYDIAGEEDACRIAERIIASIDDTILIEGAPIDIGISIGLALSRKDDTDVDDIFRRADAALHEAKSCGRNAFRLSNSTAARASGRNALALDMKEAIRRHDFFLAYQPVIDLRTNGISSFEALMRWRHPALGMVSPADFIPVAEDTGLILPLGAWALSAACRQATAWPEHVHVAVNVSPIQFKGGLEKAVLDALAETQLAPERLTLEITESVLFQNAEQAVATLHRLRDLGVKIALDDFGTGFSSLSYLRRFPFDKIKIDRAFVRDIVDPDAAAIVKAVVSIGDRLGIGIVAEGIETENQLHLVRQEGCGEAQGFLFSRPLAPEDATKLLQARTSLDAACDVGL